MSYLPPMLSVETQKALKVMILSDPQLQEAIKHYEALHLLLEFQVNIMSAREYWLVYRDIEERLGTLTTMREYRQRDRDWHPERTKRK